MADLFNRFEQEPETPDSLSARFERYPKEFPVARWVLENSTGDVVAYANSVHAQVDKKIFLVRAEVADPWQRQGIGRRLIEVAEAFAREHEAEWLMSKVRDDLDRERRFLEAAGYEQEQHLYGVELDIQNWTDPSRPGANLTSWQVQGDTPANRRKLFDLYYSTDSDTPGIELWGQSGFDEWEPSIFNARWFRPEGCIIAVGADGDWVGLSLVGPLSGGDFTTDFTGVVQSHRGRGIAMALKVAGIRWANVEGCLRMHTFNDDRNAPMRAINAKLGFEAKTGWRMMKKR